MGEKLVFGLLSDLGKARFKSVFRFGILPLLSVWPVKASLGVQESVGYHVAWERLSLEQKKGIVKVLHGLNCWDVQEMWDTFKADGFVFIREENIAGISVDLRLLA